MFNYINVHDFNLTTQGTSVETTHIDVNRVDLGGMGVGRVDSCLLFVPLLGLGNFLGNFQLYISEFSWNFLTVFSGQTRTVPSSEEE
jgi:hypothetical protein